MVVLRCVSPPPSAVCSVCSVVSKSAPASTVHRARSQSPPAHHSVGKQASPVATVPPRCARMQKHDLPRPRLRPIRYLPGRFDGSIASYGAAQCRLEVCRSVRREWRFPLRSSTRIQSAMEVCRSVRRECRFPLRSMPADSVGD